jgi:hypothetical protein
METTQMLLFTNSTQDAGAAAFAAALQKNCCLEDAVKTMSRWKLYVTAMVSRAGIPQTGEFFVENPIEMDDSGQIVYPQILQNS